MGAAGGEFIDMPDRSGSSRQELLVIGEVPMQQVQAFCVRQGMSHFVRITYQQACWDRYELADFMDGAEGLEQADAETVRQYFQILTCGNVYERIAAVLTDSLSWEDEGNLFLSGPDAPLADLPTAVYREPKYQIVGSVTEPTIEVVRP